MDKLNKLAMPNVKSGTPQEKMNAVKKALQSLEMLTEAYNQIVPVINEKIDWLNEAEQVAKDDTQDKKIDELIAVNKMLLGRITTLESKPAPKPIEFDDSAMLGRLSDIDKSIESLDKRVDFIRRTYSEKWQQAEFERAKFQQSISEQITKIETPESVNLSGIEKRLDALEAVEHVNYDDSAIKKTISAIKKSIPQPINLTGVESRIKKLENKPNYFYNDKPLLKEIDSIKSELSGVKKTFNEIFE